MKPDISFKCIVPSCERSAVGNHAICNYHLFFEIVITVVVSLAFIGACGAGIIWMTS